jgi:hypothetical protein
MLPLVCTKKGFQFLCFRIQLAQFQIRKGEKYERTEERGRGSERGPSLNEFTGPKLEVPFRLAAAMMTESDRQPKMVMPER